jgi:hypothetical protein
MLDNLSDRVVKTHGNLIMMNLKNISASHAKKLKERMESS